MNIAIACDHRGYEAKKKLIPLLKKLGHEVQDFGCEGTAAVDYPDFAIPAAKAVGRRDA
jgi:ribose 5-phosphate isomerase B